MARRPAPTDAPTDAPADAPVTAPATGRSDAPACTVTAPEDGIYAAGQRHQATAASYPAGYFSLRQLDEMAELGFVIETH